MESIIQAEIITLVIIVTPFQITIIVHIAAGQTISRLFTATGYAQLVRGRHCRTPQDILPIGIKEYKVRNIGKSIIKGIHRIIQINIMPLVCLS